MTIQAKFLTDEQTRPLVEIARTDLKLWAALKDIEQNRFHADGSEKRPNRIELVIEFADNNDVDRKVYELGNLIMALRKEVRIELGLPV